MTKFRLLFFLASMLCILGIHAQKTLNIDTKSWEDSPSNSSVTKTMTATKNGYEVTYQFHKALVMPDKTIPETELWYLDGFTLNNVPGEPAYPYSSDSFAIPIGYTASVNVLEEEWYIIESKIASGRAPRLLSDTTSLTSQSIQVLKTRKGWFPTTSASENWTTAYKDIDIINVGITPMQFDSYNGKARICKTLRYEVVFEETSSTPNTKSSNQGYRECIEEEYTDDPYLSATTLNWSFERQKANQKAKANGIFSNIPAYLIITTSGYKNSISEFVEWKKLMGFDVIVSTSDSWTSQSIKKEISRIKLIYPKLSYMLIVGNNQQVPSEYVSIDFNGSQKSTWSDLQYALTAKRNSDSTYNFVPDIKYGRIPVNSVAEAELVFSRIINYEKNAPSSDDSFYANPLFLSTFLDLNKDGQADMRNCQTSYEIADKLKGIGKHPFIDFLAGYYENPLRWGDPGWEDGTKVLSVNPNIPTKMRKPYYKWDVNVPRIKTRLNNGTSQLYYFAHGDRYGWDSMLTTSNIDGISNGNKLPVAFSLACLTGDFSLPGCFAEKMMTLASGGVIAMYAFTNKTYVAYTDIVAAAFYNGMYPRIKYKPYIDWNENENDKTTFVPPFENGVQITELGALDCYAKNSIATLFPDNEMNKNYKEYEISMLTLFGDPSMHIYLSRPNYIKAIVSVNGNKLYVTVEEDDAIVTLYNKKTGEVRNQKGNISGDTLPSDFVNYIVCIHKPGYLPYVMNLSNVSPKLLSRKSENQLVREDRIWTYHNDYCGTVEPHKDININIRFSGTTEINGKTYHNCYAYKEENEFSEIDSPIIAYMREEDNKVYAYYQLFDIQDFEENIINQYGIDIMAIGPTTRKYNCENCERMIFDFNLKKDDILWFNRDKIESDRAFMTVTDVFETDYEGNIFLTQQYGDPRSLNYTAYEGVGSFTGLLPYPGAESIDYSHSTYCLLKMTDLDGNILFANPEYLKFYSGINNTEYTSSVIESRYFDMQGRRLLSKPTDGIYIQIDIMEDGTSKVTRNMGK